MERAGLHLLLNCPGKAKRAVWARQCSRSCEFAVLDALKPNNQIATRNSVESTTQLEVLPPLTFAKLMQVWWPEGCYEGDMDGGELAGHGFSIP